jgi:NAD(P)-dependent dehydrogenase (short-subunit alcohol dehydrogenase family)
MGQVQDKVAIVTGGASGIGAACAELLAREGAKVLVTDLDDAHGSTLVDKINKCGGEALYWHHDVSEEQGWLEVIAILERHYGRLDILVANAGIVILGGAIEMPLADWRRLMTINVDGVFLSAKYAVPAMRRSGGGSIVIMSSVAGLRGSARWPGYCASKGAVRLFAKALALECAEAGDNIRVNSVHPGAIETPMWPAGIDVHELAKAVVPISRAGQAQEVANCVLFLASDAASYLTGSEIVVDGGLSAGSGLSRRESSVRA